MNICIYKYIYIHEHTHIIYIYIIEYINIHISDISAVPSSTGAVIIGHLVSCVDGEVIG